MKSDNFVGGFRNHGYAQPKRGKASFAALNAPSIEIAYLGYHLPLQLAGSMLLYVFN